MIRRRSTELVINHERWLVSYADFVTLLFGFFVVMYSASQMHEMEYQKLSTTLGELFSAIPVSEIDGELEIQQPLSIDKEELRDVSEAVPSSAEQFPSVSPRPMAELPILEGILQARFSDLIGSDQVTLESNAEWLQLTLNNKVLFALGSVQPSQQAKHIMEDIGVVLRQYNNPIQVEGFTDNLPINTRQFPSNWELSTARASAIVKLLIDAGVSPENLAAVGYGEFHPVADNGTTAGRAQNRRVVLLIGRQLRQRPGLHRTGPVSQVPPSLQEAQQHVHSTQPETTLGPEDTPVPLSGAQETSRAAPSSKSSDITPITLKDGNLLFTSDPEKIRASEKQ